MRISKIIVALLVSVVALTAMAGVAVASPSDVDIDTDPLINPLDGSVTTHVITVTILDIDAGPRHISVWTESANLQAKVTGGPGGVNTGWTSTSAMPPAGDNYTAVSGTHTQKDDTGAYSTSHEQYTFTLSIKGNINAEGEEVTVADNIGNTYTTAAGSDSSSATRKVFIPEFATIAIPAIAVLGLFLFFNKRKQKKD